MKTLRCMQLVMLVFLLTNYASGAPVAHYTFNDSGDRYGDVSGNGYDGTINGSGTTFVSSGVTGLGDAIDFTTGGRVLVNTPIPISLSDFSISFWATSGAGWDNWITFGGTDDFYLQNAPYAPPAIYLYNYGGVGGYSSWDLSTIMEAGLNHIVITADSAAETISIYYNGTLADTGTWTVASSETMDYLTIGGARSTTARNIDATIDDVQIYDTALSSDDATYLYSNPGNVIPEPATMGLVVLFSATGIFIRRCFMI